MTYYGTSTTNCFVAYDGNGNVSALINAANGMTVANFEYGPFGELIRATGPMAKLNPFRFSTKYDDDESDFLYYGYRYYNPSTGRWLSRDPIEEKGGLNLYANVANNELSFIDPDGRGIVNCIKALAKLAKAAAKVAGRCKDIEQDVLGTGLDSGHQAALNNELSNLNEAYRLVAQHCKCNKAQVAAALAAAGKLIQEALDYLEKVANDPAVQQDIDEFIQILEEGL